MSTGSANLDPKNFLMLAALGIAAYWLATRPARAGTTSRLVPTVGAAQPRSSSNANLVNGVLAGLSTWFKGGATGEQYGAQAIDNTALPGGPGYGWQYFTDGTAISPEGEYYYQGEKVWTPSTMDASAINYVNGASGSW